MKVHVCVRRAGSDDEVKCNSKTDAILSQMDAGDLTEQIIGRYQSTFSKNEDDIGFCDLVRKQLAQRRVPPHQWQEVRDYIQKSLDQGIIRVIQSFCIPNSPF